MEQEIMLRHVSLAEKHVAKGMMLVERQRLLVENLARDGYDTSKHEELLQQFERLLAFHIEGRDRLLRELANASDKRLLMADA